MNSSRRAVLFDLDGTLVDTAPDLIGAMNDILLADGYAAHDAAVLRCEASNGSRGLIGSTLGILPDDARFLPLQQRFLQGYQSRMSRESHCFPDVEALLVSLQSAGISWGIVSNKPHHLTCQLVAELGLRPAVVLGGDASCRPKPAPDLLELAAAHLRISPTQCVYVGDAPRDIAAGRAAGMLTLAAAYGYIADGEDLAQWGADAIAHNTDQLWPLIQQLCGA